MGRRKEALGHLRKCLEIKEVTLEKDCSELGKANRDLAKAFVAVLDSSEPLPYCMKALEINKKHLDQNSVEVETALKLNKLSRKILKNSREIDMKLFSLAKIDAEQCARYSPRYACHSMVLISSSSCKLPPSSPAGSLHRSSKLVVVFQTLDGSGRLLSEILSRKEQPLQRKIV